MNLKKRLMKFFRKNNVVENEIAELQKEIDRMKNQKTGFLQNEELNDDIFEEAQEKIKKFIKLHYSENVRDIVPYEYYARVDMSKPICFDRDVILLSMKDNDRRFGLVNVIGWSNESVWIKPEWSTVCRLDKTNIVLYKHCPKKPEQIPVITEYTMDELTKKLGHNFKIVK